MASLFEHRQRASQLSSDKLSRSLFDFIKTTSDYLVEMNREQINIKSQDIYGEAIGFYSKATEYITNGAKEWGTPFTGKDTGDWLKGFYISINYNTLFFGSTDPKTDDILESKHWLSHDLFGLTEENLAIAVNEKFLPFMQSHSREVLGL